MPNPITINIPDLAFANLSFSFSPTTLHMPAPIVVQAEELELEVSSAYYSIVPDYGQNGNKGNPLAYPASWRNADPLTLPQNTSGRPQTITIYAHNKVTPSGSELWVDSDGTLLENTNARIVVGFDSQLQPGNHNTMTCTIDLLIP